MKSTLATVAVALFAISEPQHADAFSSAFSGSQLSNSLSNTGSSSLTMEYIPSGMSKEQWNKIKSKDKKKTQGKNLGANGITSFKSRTFAEWQKAGGVNLFPVDPNSVKDASEIPYMQRPGGMPDDSDLKGKKGKKKSGGFTFGAKKAAPKKPVVEEKPKKKGWW